MSNFSFSHSVFKRLILQTRKNQGLFGKGLNTCIQKRFHSCPGFTIGVSFMPFLEKSIAEMIESGTSRFYRSYTLPLSHTQPREFQEKLLCLWNTTAPEDSHFLKSVALVFDLDTTRCQSMRYAFIPNMSLVTKLL